MIKPFNCPNCDSINIKKSDFYHLENNNIYIDVLCVNCKYEYTEHYELKGFAHKYKKPE